MNFKNLLFSALGLAVAATALPASAQEQGPLEEIVVTSAKREQTLQDTGRRAETVASI
jgi:outer membrane cobalamin receptor